ncbi:MAG: hypothetical protein HY052_09025 [Proteobacteria bacterium]|nr:hypothetical protein [Pseudomonadota bacterium]
MKYKIFAAALFMVMGLSVAAHAADPATSSPTTPTEKSAGQPPMGGDMPAGGMMMPCPMMEKMGGMQKGMGDMMGDMQDMMKMTSDPAMKERMQKMHEKMEAMMHQMSGMPKMCGKNCPMMEKMGMEKTGEEKVNNAPAAPAAVTPEDHKAHHPEKQ